MTKKELINKIKQTLTENPDKCITPAELEETLIAIVNAGPRDKIIYIDLDILLEIAGEYVTEMVKDLGAVSQFQSRVTAPNEVFVEAVKSGVFGPEYAGYTLEQIFDVLSKETINIAGFVPYAYADDTTPGFKVVRFCTPGFDGGYQVSFAFVVEERFTSIIVEELELKDYE